MLKTASDTIAAIATPNAAGGIGIVRISGPDALRIAARIFAPKSGADLTESPGYRVYYGHVRTVEGTVLDEALCTVFRTPKSYTGEDCAEISCHGGLYITGRVLREILAADDINHPVSLRLPPLQRRGICLDFDAVPFPSPGGVPRSGGVVGERAMTGKIRAARPGEFTERAYLNGRMALEQAEAVAALISARGESALKAANAVLEGTLGAKLAALTETIAACSAEVAAWVDYPDEDIPEPDAEALTARLLPVRAGLDALLKNYDSGRALLEGADTVICGRPNTGKSTLMNLLCGSERAIVTDIPGTTRDVLEETVRLGEIPLRLADTAGLRESESAVEKIGVERARERVASAELVFAVLDGSLPIVREDRELLESCASRRAVIIVNKCDLPQAMRPDELEGYGKPVVALSAKTGEGLEDLRRAAELLLGTAEFDPAAATLINERQRACCGSALANTDEAIAALRTGVTLDAVQIILDAALNALLELRGKTASEAVTAAVFEGFCVGK